MRTTGKDGDKQAAVETVKIIGNGAEAPKSDLGIFENLEALRLDQTPLTSTKEIVAHIPIRRPDRRTFFRVHPDPEMTITATIFEDDTERETFFVTPEMRPHLIGFLKPVLLSVCMSRQNVFFLWPVRLPDDDGSGGARSWGETARTCADMARTQWVSLRSDMKLGAYRIHQAEGALPDPTWPNLSLNQILVIAFKGRIIDNPEHIVVRR